MKSFFAALLFCLFFSCTAMALPMNASSTQEIVDSLNTFTDRWNQGDMTNALKIYKYSDTTELISTVSVVKGYTNIIDYFEMSYPSEQDMGKMSFSDIHVNVLTPTYATAVGKWSVLREKSGASNGVFTVVFEKTEDGWKIALDHTSGVKSIIS